MEQVHSDSIDNSRKEEEELVQPLFHNGMFSNPWDTWTNKGIGEVVKFVLSEKPKRSKPPMNAEELNEKLPVFKPDFKILQNPDQESIHVTWLGHASTLVQMEGINFLTDPVFCPRASPVSFAGPKRYRDIPCELKDLPPISFIVISHDHYDHLDIEVVHHFSDSVKWFVPKGLKKWFLNTGVSNVEELNWWETTKFNNFEITCTPCQHWSKRNLTQQRTTLWGSWVICGQQKRVFYSGDTGYCTVFKTIGKKYGPFDFAMIPIGCYTPREFMKAQHINPYEAVSIHEDIKSKSSLGVHWGTYAMGVSFRYEAEDEPPQTLKKAAQEKGLRDNEFITTFIGQTYTL